jgi:hypothetical protein
MSKVSNTLAAFAGGVSIENVHPLQLGFGRRKVRTQRRYGLPLENPLLFYARRAFEAPYAVCRWLWLFLRVRIIRKRIQADPQAVHYSDEAIRVATPTDIDEVVHLYADSIPKTYGAPVREVVEA